MLRPPDPLRVYASRATFVHATCRPGQARAELTEAQQQGATGDSLGAQAAGTDPLAKPSAGFGTGSPRVLIHSLLGSALYGAVVAKVLIVRSSRFAPWVLPVAGGLLFSILLGLWLTSALWFFTAPSVAT
jgi:uncharacterized protein DUF6529